MGTHIVNVGYESTNYYVIASDFGNRLLIDCGWRGTMGKLKGEMRRKGIELGEVSHLLVTHLHPDHAGLTQELRGAGMKLVLMNVQLPYLKDHVRPEKSEVEIRAEGILVLKPEESRVFLKKLGFHGEVIPSPGHSPDSVSLVLDEGIAFTGDLTLQHLLPQDEVTCRGSWKRISAMGAKVIYPGHGVSYRND